MRTLDKQECRIMLYASDPERFKLSVTPWETYILIDRCFEYYDTPSKE